MGRVKDLAIGEWVSPPLFPLRLIFLVLFSLTSPRVANPSSWRRGSPASPPGPGSYFVRGEGGVGGRAIRGMNGLGLTGSKWLIIGQNSRRLMALARSRLRVQGGRLGKDKRFPQQSQSAGLRYGGPVHSAVVRDGSPTPKRVEGAHGRWMR